MESSNYTFASLMEYCESLKGSAGESKAKSSGRLTACRVVLENALPDELEDVRSINVDSAAEKYASASGSKQKTVVEYRNRVKVAIDRFKEHVDSLTYVQPEEATGAPDKVVPPPEGKKIDIPDPVKKKRYPKPEASVNTVNVKVRSDFLAKLILPLDLTAAEAEHLCKVIKVLPFDYEE